MSELSGDSPLRMGSKQINSEQTFFKSVQKDSGKERNGVKIKKRSGRPGSVLLDLLYPRRCPVCDRPTAPFGAEICSGCEQEIHRKRIRMTDILCCQCGKPMKDPGKDRCTDCRREEHSYERGCACYRYRQVSGAVFRLKYEGRAEYAEWMGNEMTRRLLEEFGETLPDALVPVPVSAKRERKRGYNQAALLADVIGDNTGISVREDFLLRRTDTAAMKGMSASQRRVNLKKAFTAPSYDVKLKTIMLVDDIYTTGTTVDACAAALKKAGAAEVYFVTLAIGEERT